LPLPSLAISDAGIEQAKEFAKTSQGQEFIKSPEGKQALQEIKGQTEQPKETAAAQPAAAAGVQNEIGVIENAFGKNINQFGYDIFKTASASFAPTGDVPVGQDYIIGPGDSFNITLWGVSEGAFKADVGREGNIIVPKIGIVHVAGLTYGDLKPVLEQELSKYYEKINVGISIADIRTIRVFMVGEVARPGSYSVSSLSTLFNALFIAGGPTKRGTLRNIELIRNGRTIAVVDLYKFLLSGDKSQDQSLQSGDTIYIPIIGPTIGIAGNVYRPAVYEVKGSPDLADVVRMAGGVLPNSYLKRVQIERVINHEKKVILDKQIPFSPNTKSYDIPMRSMDYVNVFAIFSDIGNAVKLEGSVKYPGPYELKTDSRVKDIIKSPKDLLFSAYLPKVEIVRMDKYNLNTKVLSFDLQKLFAGNESQNLKLESGDRIVVASELREQQKVNIMGEVKLPGSYFIAPGERLSSVIERAGGYTENAYLYGVIFVRKSAKNAQMLTTQKMIFNLETVIMQKEQDLTALSPEMLEEKKTDLDRNREMLARLKTQAVEGRVVVALDDPEKMKGSKDDIELEDGDSITIPPIPKIINVVGEVYSPSSLVYYENEKVGDYINKLGGYTRNADRANIYILRANGFVISREQKGNDIIALRLNPGDSIIVPQRIDRFDFFATVRDFTKWFYEVAVAYAVVHTALK
jgi:protein involved in polysaccharide export with SLBB domain